MAGCVELFIPRKLRWYLRNLPNSQDTVHQNFSIMQYQNLNSCTVPKYMLQFKQVQYTLAAKQVNYVVFLCHEEQGKAVRMG